MPRVVLHVGSGKCGSSSLQRYFSFNPTIKNQSGGVTRYAVLDAKGRLRTGRAITAQAAQSLSEYQASAPLDALIDHCKTVAVYIDSELDEHDVLLLSNEGWRSKIKSRRDLDFEALLGTRVEVMFAFRPQLDFLNSAFWQWGAWSGQSLSDWIERRKQSALWAEQLAAWSKIPGVNRVHGVLLATNFFEQVFDILDIDGEVAPEAAQHNTSLPGAALRVMQRHSERLRPTINNTAIEFVLSRTLSIPDDRTPWVLDLETQTGLLEFYSSSNNNLAQFVAPAIWQRILSNERWWSPRRDAPTEPVTPPPPRSGCGCNARR